MLFTNDAFVDSQSSEANDLTLDAGAQSVFFNENIGAGVDGELGQLIVEEADGLNDAGVETGGVVFGQSAASIDDDDDGVSASDDVGAVNFIELVGDTGTGSESTFDLNLGSLDIIGIGNLTGSDGEQRSASGIVFNGGNDNSRDTGVVDDLLTIQTTNDDIRLNGSVRLDSDVVLDTDLDDSDDLTRPSVTGGDVLFTNDAFVDSQSSEANDLTLDAGAQSVFFNENIGAGVAGELGQLIVEEADGLNDAGVETGGVVFGQSAASGADDDDGVSANVDVGAVNFIELVGDTGTGSESTFDLNFGSLDIIGIGNLTGSDGEQRSASGIVFNGGNDNSRDTATIDDVLTIQTTNDDIRLNGSVRLDSDVVIDTDLDDSDDLTRPSMTGGDVLFTNDAFVDSQSDVSGDSEGNTLQLDAGRQSIFFNEDIGALTGGELGQLIVEEADGLDDAGAVLVSGGVVFGQSMTSDEDDDDGVSANSNGADAAEDRG